jgi:hypothetical protein
MTGARYPRSPESSPGGRASLIIHQFAVAQAGPLWLGLFFAKTPQLFAISLYLKPVISTFSKMVVILSEAKNHRIYICLLVLDQTHPKACHSEPSEEPLHLFLLLLVLDQTHTKLLSF